MSRHSKWAKIKRGKAVEDSKRGKIFTRHAKLIEVAARNGGDPSMNPLLRAAIDNARADNTPMENIERAIKKGTGEAKLGIQIEEVVYEGFGPGGTALYMEALTDNRNRTISNLKTIMNKKGGTMGAAGSVGYMFSKKGLIVLPCEGPQSDEAELAAIDAGADDVNEGDGCLEIYTAPQDLMKVKDALITSGFKTESARLVYVPVTEIAVNDAETASNLLELMDAIEDDDDILNVYTNADISDEVMAGL